MSTADTEERHLRFFILERDAEKLLKGILNIIDLLKRDENRSGFQEKFGFDICLQEVNPSSVVGIKIYKTLTADYWRNEYSQPEMDEFLHDPTHPIHNDVRICWLVYLKHWQKLLEQSSFNHGLFTTPNQTSLGHIEPIFFRKCYSDIAFQVITNLQQELSKEYPHSHQLPPGVRNLRDREAMAALGFSSNQELILKAIIQTATDAWMPLASDELLKQLTNTDTPGYSPLWLDVGICLSAYLANQKILEGKWAYYHPDNLFFDPESGAEYFFRIRNSLTWPPSRSLEEEFARQTNLIETYIDCGVNDDEDRMITLHWLP